jgi:hypothetical protein
MRADVDCRTNDNNIFQRELIAARAIVATTLLRVLCEFNLAIAK